MLNHEHQVWRFLSHMADALQYLHGQRPPIIHRGPIQLEKVWLEFWLKKQLDIWLDIAYTKKSLKMCS